MTVHCGRSVGERADMQNQRVGNCREGTCCKWQSCLGREYRGKSKLSCRHLLVETKTHTQKERVAKRCMDAARFRFEMSLARVGYQSARKEIRHIILPVFVKYRHGCSFLIALSLTAMSVGPSLVIDWQSVQTMVGLTFWAWHAAARGFHFLSSRTVGRIY